MRTRVLLLLTVAVLAGVLAPARAQQPTKIPRVGILGLAYRSSPFLESFRQGLRELGYIEGQNIILETRPSNRNDRRLDERLYDLATELVRSKVDVIVAQSGPATYAAMNATKTTPIVMTFIGDPVSGGIVASLKRPGGNVTGVSGLPTGLGGKMLELIKETVPGASRVAVFWNPERAGQSRKGVEVAAQARAVEVQVLETRGQDDLGDAFKAANSWRADVFLVLPGTGGNVREAAQLSLKSRLPGIFWRADFAAAGGLMSYGAHGTEQSRRAAYTVDKILRGAKPADLPVETPMRFELVINLKTAKEIGVIIPPGVLAWADTVIK